MKGDASKIYDFCAAIVDTTHDLVNSFKPQIAYFAAHRAEDQLEKLMEHMRRVAPHARDSGCQARRYRLHRRAIRQGSLRALWCRCRDALSFMGFDSITPYLKYEGKGHFCCPHLNPGGDDLQARSWPMCPATPICSSMWPSWPRPWNTNGQLGLVVGATRPNEIERVRAVAPTLPLLIPGVGAQGGDAVATVKAARIGGGPIIINSSRAILYAGQGDDFAKAAREAAIATRHAAGCSPELSQGRLWPCKANGWKTFCFWLRSAASPVRQSCAMSPICVWPAHSCAGGMGWNAADRSGRRASSPHPGR
jgi:orotidine-5'-phosphate decarboxylase